MAVLRGPNGIIQLGPTNALTEFPYVRTWSFTTTRAVLTGGPWINNDDIEKDVGPKDSSGSLEFDIPVDLNNGYKAIRAAYEAGTALRLLLQSDDGEQIIINEALITSMERSLPADGIYNGSLEFIPKSGYTAQDTP